MAQFEGSYLKTGVYLGERLGFPLNCRFEEQDNCSSRDSSLNSVSFSIPVSHSRTLAHVLQRLSEKNNICMHAAVMQLHSFKTDESNLILTNVCF